jgi:hypothetical protein
VSYLACSTNDLQLEALFLVVVVKLCELYSLYYSGVSDEDEKGLFPSLTSEYRV